ncbi:MAG: hypothetical protein E7535_08115 [Ruminococcaceae bacterium]|nr:hypothetical protein [Oscillospiraceae bacterium]
MTFIEKFDYLKKKYGLKADTSKFKDDFIAAQITMSDEDCGGTFYAAFIDGKLSVEPYDYHDNTVAVIVNSLLLEECIKGKADPVKEYLAGNLQAWGNLDHALQLIEALKGKKRTAKKTEKAEVKEEAAPKKSSSKKKTAPSEAAEVKSEEITEPAPKKRACKKKEAPADTAVKAEEKPAEAPKKRTCKRKTTEKE